MHTLAFLSYSSLSKCASDLCLGMNMYIIYWHNMSHKCLRILKMSPAQKLVDKYCLIPAECPHVAKMSNFFTGCTFIESLDKIPEPYIPFDFVSMNSLRCPRSISNCHASHAVLFIQNYMSQALCYTWSHAVAALGFYPWRDRGPIS
jgi:hypothetical protein